MNKLSGGIFILGMFITAFIGNALAATEPAMGLLVTPVFLALTYFRSKKLEQLELFYVYAGLVALGVFVPQALPLVVIVNLIVLGIMTFKNAPSVTDEA